jgi:hypothetical protein
MPASVAAHAARRGPGDAPQPGAQQRRRQQRGRQHHQEQGGVEVVAQHPGAQADRREDQAHLAAGQHAQPDGELVARRSGGTDAGGELAGDRSGQERPRQAQHRRAGEGRDVGVDPDLQEEHGNEHLAERHEIPPDPVGLGAAGQGQARHERPHDRGEPGGIGELGEAERERQRQGEQRAVRPGPPVQQAEQRRRQPQARRPAHDEEPHRQACQTDDAGGTQRRPGDEAGDDRQDHQAEHVVGDGRAEDGAGLGARQRTEIPEDPGGDAHAGGGERRAHEDRRVAAVAERGGGTRPERERQGHPADGHQQRRPPDRAQLRQLELQAHLEQQQDHP